MSDIQRIIQLKPVAIVTVRSPGCWGLSQAVNEYVLNLGGSGKDFGALSRLDEESLTSILPEPKTFNKPQAYLVSLPKNRTVIKARNRNFKTVR